MKCIGFIWFSAVSIFSACAVTAGDLNDLVAAKDGRTNCWSRDYGAAHMEAHPDQEVTGIGMTVSFWDESAISPAQYVFRMEVDLRDGSQGTAIGQCRMEGKNVWCGVECDGGGVLLNTRGNRDLLIDLEHTGFIAMKTSCEDGPSDEGFTLESGRDDKQFLLKAMPQHHCIPAKY